MCLVISIAYMYTDEIANRNRILYGKVQLVFITTKMTYGRLEDFLEAPQFLPLIYLSTMLYSCYPLSEMKWSRLGHDRMVVKSPKQSLGDLLFLLRFLLLLFFSFSFSFLSADHELVHGRSQELLDRIS